MAKTPKTTSKSAPEATPEMSPNTAAKTAAQGSTPEQTAAPAPKTVENSEEPASARPNRIKTGETGRSRRQAYLKLKAFTMEREPKNFSKLMILHEKDGWWKMFGHSALMFFYDVSKWINHSSKLRPDSDYDYPSPEGVVIIHDIDALHAKLIHAKIQPIDIKSAYRIYNIGKKYTPSDLAFFRDKHALEEAKVNSMLVPKEVMPELYTQLRELVHRTYFTAKTFEGFARESFGRPIVELAKNVMFEYVLLARGEGREREDFLHYVIETMDRIDSRMVPVVELRLVPPQRIFQILKLTSRVRREAERCLPPTP